MRDVRPIERVFVGDPDVSETLYRLLKASRDGRRLQEEVRVPGPRGEPARWLRLRVRPLGAAVDAGGTRKASVWTVADVTRDRERQENVFQELQHAIDYLDHAPAGFFSVDGRGDIGYINATLALNRAMSDGTDPLQAAEVRFMRFFNNTPMAIATVDRSGRIARHNGLFARLFPIVRTGEAASSQASSIRSVVAEGDRAALDEALAEAA